MKRIVNVYYTGECPVCWERQSGSSPSKVDVECGICEARRLIREAHDTEYKALIGGTILNITGYDDKGMPSNIDIQTSDAIYDILFKKIKISSVYPWKKK